MAYLECSKKFKCSCPLDEIGTFSHGNITPPTYLRRDKSRRKLSHYINGHNVKFPSSFPDGFEYIQFIRLGRTFDDFDKHWVLKNSTNGDSPISKLQLLPFQFQVNPGVFVRTANP